VDAVNVSTVGTATFVQALSFFCELEMDKQRTGLRRTEVSTDTVKNAVAGLPQIPELVSFQTVLLFSYFFLWSFKWRIWWCYCHQIFLQTHDYWIFVSAIFFSRFCQNSYLQLGLIWIGNIRYSSDTVRGVYRGEVDAACVQFGSVPYADGVG